MTTRRNLSPENGKEPSMVNLRLFVGLTLFFLCLSPMVNAGPIEERVQRHIEAAVEGGLTPADYHHLVFAFSWRTTLEDWTLAERGLDRLAAARQIDPLMADEIRLLRAEVEIDRGGDAAARELFRTMGGLTSWWFHEPVTLEELTDFEEIAVPPPAEFEWRATPGTDPSGWVRVSGLAWPPQRQMAYLATTVVSDREQPVAVRVGVAQVARVWLNGVELVTTPQPLDRAPDQAVGGGWLREGENAVVIAVASEDDRWWLRARLTRPDGSAIDGVREIRQPPAVHPPIDSEPPDVRELGSEIRKALAEGTPGAAMALAAFLVARHPEPVGGGGVRAACRDARAEMPGEARLLEWLVTTEPGAARDLLSEALKEDPDLLWARLELAAWYGERGLYEQAHNLLTETDTTGAVIRGAMLDFDAALWGPLVVPRLAELGRAYPLCVRVNIGLAEAAIDARRWDLATEAAMRLAEVTPGAVNIMELNERIAESCGDGSAMRELLSTRLERESNAPRTRVRLARLLAADGDLESARSMLSVGLERSPTDVDLMMELASIEHSVADDAAATVLARGVLEIRPQDRRAQRLLELLGEVRENLDWLRSPDDLWWMADAAPAATPAVAILDHQQIRFLPSRLTEERVQQVFLITDAARADELRSQHIPYVAENQRLRVLRARILRRDGSEVGARQGDTPRLSEPEFNLYYDTRLRVLRFDELENGDLVEIAYVLSETNEANETGPYNGGLIPLGRGVPVALMEVELVGQGAILPDWEIANLEGEPVRDENDQGVVRLRWEWRDLPAIPTDVPAAPQLLVMPYLVYSNHPQWGDLADWYGRHVASRVRTSEQVEETAHRLVIGLDERLDRINRLYRFVTIDIRYVGLEFGEHRYRPFSADWVLHHRIGDCKDKAALLMALLDAIGVPARMVMIRTADLGPVSSGLAVLEVFNHAIVYLPEDDLWLDGTATGHAPYPPPSMDQDAFVLVVDGSQSRPQFSPTVGAGRTKIRFALEPGDDSDVAITIETRDTGEAADRRRGRFAGSRDPQRFARWLQELFPGAQLTGEPAMQLVPGRDPTIVEIEGTISKSALASGGGVGTYPGNLEWAARMVPGGTRHGPLKINVRPDLEWSLEVDLGRPPKTLPDEIELETPFGSLHITTEILSNGYRVDGSLHFEPGTYDAEEVGGLREFLVTVERHLERRLAAP
jgi:transglutaminase-like putative cysteine protease